MDMHLSRSHKALFPATIGLLLVTLCMPVHAATFVVDSTADAPDATTGDDICADSQGRCTLRAAIMQANALSGADTIDLSGINDPNNPIILTIPGVDETAEQNASGGYDVVATHDASKGDLNITDSVTITGAGSASTIVEWDPSVKNDPGTGDRVFHIEAVSTNIDVNISGLTIQNGVVPAPETLRTLPDDTYYQLKRSGAGIAIGPAAAVSLIDPNAPSGGDGGGGTPPPPGGDEGETAATITGVTLTDVNILDNQSGGDGGGIYNAAPLTLTNAVVSGNSAVANGGGIYNDAAMAVADSTIGSKTGFANANTAEGGGGIFDTGFHTTTIAGSTISGNTAVGGGGISARSLIVVDISNSTVVGNSATDVGGGITTNGTVNLENVTVADNSAASDSTGGGAGLNAFGSGVYNYVNTLFNNNQTTGTTPAVVSCGCSGGSGCKAGVMVSGGHNLADDESCSLTAIGDQPNTVSALQTLTNNGGLTETRALLSTDPAVDTGDDANCPNSDQRGSIRPADGDLDNTPVCDIGAFELFIDRADLHAQRKNAPDKVIRGNPANVSIDYLNSSTTTDANTVTVTTDPLPSTYSFTSATLTTPEGTATCSLDTNTRVVSCTAPGTQTLAAGQTATFDLQGTPTAPGTLTITATVAASTADTYPDNDSATVNILVQGNSNLAVTGSATSSSVNLNASTTLNFKVQNMGQDPANNVRFLAQFSNKLTFKAMTPSTGTCTLQSDNVSVLCELGTIAAGDSVTGTLDVTAASEGTADVLFQVTTDDADTDATNDASIVSLAIAALPTSSSGGGGCVLRPGGGFDPTLPAVVAAGLIGLGLRRRMVKKA